MISFIYINRPTPMMNMRPRTLALLLLMIGIALIEFGIDRGMLPQLKTMLKHFISEGPLGLP